MKMMMMQKFNNNLDKLLAQLDDSQLAAILSNNENIVIKAFAGSGKTKVLIAAIALYRYNHPDKNVCAITYTRAAKSEMESRLMDLGIRNVDVTTIHVWAREQLKYFAKKYDFKVKILEEPQIKAILQDIVNNYLKRSKIRSVNIDILYRYITGSKKMDISENYRRILNILEQKYISYKIDNRLYDFTDYPKYLYDIINYYDETITTIDALFVDEFQDVDTIQLELFNKVKRDGCQKFFIGDPWQSIYIFRNADGAVFNKLDNFEKFRLRYNYRSYQEIVDYATTVYETLKREIDNNGDGNASCYITQCDFINGGDKGASKSQKDHSNKIYCSRGYGGIIQIVKPYGYGIQFGDGSKDGSNIYRESFNNAEDRLLLFMEKKPMVLCRTNKQVSAVREAGYNNVDTVHQAKGLEYNNVVIIDSTIEDIESLNVAYVAITRARDAAFIINWNQFEDFFVKKDRNFFTKQMNGLV